MARLARPSCCLHQPGSHLPPDVLPSDPLQSLYDPWLSLVGHLNIKAFVNLTLADSVRHGAQHLLFISCLGSGLANPSSSKDPREHRQGPQFQFPSLRGDSEPKDIWPEEYVGVITDTVKMLKNLTLVCNFCHFDQEGSELKVTGAARGLSISVAPEFPLSRQLRLRGHLLALSAAAGVRTARVSSLALYEALPLPVHGAWEVEPAGGSKAASDADGIEDLCRGADGGLGPCGDAGRDVRMEGTRRDRRRREGKKTRNRWRRS
uniref:Uncharacterized protein n=1 Tax=Hucho hucho TaxID=62062 RepID=A0A4W5QS82_9TELE